MGGEPGLPEGGLGGLQWLQRAEKMHQIPRFRRLEIVGERGHRRAIDTGHEDPVEILVGLSTLEAGTGGEVVRHDPVVLAVHEGGSGGTITPPGGAMALPAFHPLERRPTPEDALDGRGRLSRDHDRRAGALHGPPRGEGLDVGHQIHPGLTGERRPGGHVGVHEPAGHRVEQVFVGGQGPGRGRAALESGGSEIARLGIDPHRVLAVAVPRLAVTPDTVPAVLQGSRRGIAVQVPDCGGLRRDRRRRQDQQQEAGARAERRHWSARLHERSPRQKSKSSAVSKLVVRTTVPGVNGASTVFPIPFIGVTPMDLPNESSVCHANPARLNMIG